MKFFQEVTADARYPLHIYLLSDNREFMYGYVRRDSNELTQFRSRYRFDVRGRRFREVANTYGYSEPQLADTDSRWQVQGSGGNVYTVERVGGQLRCSCLSLIHI